MMFFGCLGEEKDPEDYERGFDNWRGLFKRRMMLSFAEARNQINAKMATSGETEAGGSSQDSSNIPEPSEAFNEFYAEVKEIEKHDSVLTPKQQIDRLNRPGSTYFNLNPFDVLQIDPVSTMNEIKKKYRRMSILVHPDKNQDDLDRAQKAFEALNKAYKTLENEEGMKRCQEIVEEAKVRTEDMMKQKRKQLKKEGRPRDIPEDDQEKYRYAVYVQTCKLFADLERMRQDREAREMHERKRKAEDENEEAEMKKTKAEFDKNFEESRMGRVNSWRDWKKSSGKKSKGTFRPPKTKMEQR